MAIMEDQTHESSIVAIPESRRRTSGLMLPDALSKSSEDLDELRPRQHVDVYVPAREGTTLFAGSRELNVGAGLTEGACRPARLLAQRSYVVQAASACN